MKQYMVWLSIGLLTLTSVAAAKKYPLTADKSVPATRGQVDVGHDKNGNTTVEVEVEHLAPPENLTPPKTVYVVWFQERGSEPLNQGTLNAKQRSEGHVQKCYAVKEFRYIRDGRVGLECQNLRRF